MVLGSGSHSRSQFSVANPWVDRSGFQVPPLAGRDRLAVSHRRGTVLLINTY